jgi:hypothetical protein
MQNQADYMYLLLTHPVLNLPMLSVCNTGVQYLTNVE